MNKHTPGPWTWRRTTQPYQSLENQNGVPILWYTTQDDGIHATPADEALIAAAPDLLAACREALEELGDGKDPDTPAMRTIRAAIARAEGQS